MMQAAQSRPATWSSSIRAQGYGTGRRLLVVAVLVLDGDVDHRGFTGLGMPGGYSQAEDHGRPVF